MAHTIYPHSAREQATHGATSVTAILIFIHHVTYLCFVQAPQTHGEAFTAAIMGVIHMRRANSPVADSTDKNIL